MKVHVGVYADQVYGSEWWDKPDVYGDDNEAVLSVNKDDLIEWIDEVGDFEDFDEFYGEYIYDDTDGLYDWLKENKKYVRVLGRIKPKLKEYKYIMSLCGGYTEGELKVKAYDEDDAYNRAMDYVGKRLNKMFPTVDIEYNVELVDD